MIPVGLNINMPATLTVDATASSLAERYSVGEVLGEGRFSSVMAGTCTKTGVEVALKSMAVAELEGDDDAHEMLALEVEVLRRAQACEHIVGLREVLRTPDTLHLAMERIHGCELFDAIAEAGGSGMAVPLVRRLLAQLFGALAALHALDCTHRDIKPDNLMVGSLEPPQAATLTIIDFGYAASATRGLRGLAGSPEYAAPEVLTWLDDGGGPAGGKCRLPRLTTPPHPPAWCLLGPKPLLRTPERSLSSSTARRAARGGRRAIHVRVRRVERGRDGVRDGDGRDGVRDSGGRRWARHPCRGARGAHHHHPHHHLRPPPCHGQTLIIVQQSTTIASSRRLRPAAAALVSRRCVAPRSRTAAARGGARALSWWSWSRRV